MVIKNPGPLFLLFCLCWFHPLSLHGLNRRLNEPPHAAPDECAAPCASVNTRDEAAAPAGGTRRKGVFATAAEARDAVREGGRPRLPPPADATSTVLSSVGCSYDVGACRLEELEGAGVCGTPSSHGGVCVSHTRTHTRTHSTWPIPKTRDTLFHRYFVLLKKILFF